MFNIYSRAIFVNRARESILCFGCVVVYFIYGLFIKDIIMFEILINFSFERVYLQDYAPNIIFLVVWKLTIISGTLDIVQQNLSSWQAYCLIIFNNAPRFPCTVHSFSSENFFHSKQNWYYTLKSP